MFFLLLFLCAQQRNCLSILFQLPPESLCVLNMLQLCPSVMEITFVGVTRSKHKEGLIREPPENCPRLACTCFLETRTREESRFSTETGLGGSMYTGMIAIKMKIRIEDASRHSSFWSWKRKAVRKQRSTLGSMTKEGESQIPGRYIKELQDIIHKMKSWKKWRHNNILSNYSLTITWFTSLTKRNPLSHKEQWWLKIKALINKKFPFPLFYNLNK